MAIRYRISAEPFDGPVSAPEMVQANGVVVKKQLLAAATLVPSGNYLTVIQSIVAKSTQPSSTQLAGLLGYLAAIEAETNTGAVETAIAAL